MNNNFSADIFAEMDLLLNPKAIKKAASNNAYLSALADLNKAAELADEASLPVLAEAITQVIQKISENTVDVHGDPETEAFLNKIVSIATDALDNLGQDSAVSGSHQDDVKQLRYALDSYSQALEKDPNSIINRHDIYTELYDLLGFVQAYVGLSHDKSRYSEFLDFFKLLRDAKNEAEMKNESGNFSANPLEEAFNKVKETVGFGLEVPLGGQENISEKEYIEFMQPERDLLEEEYDNDSESLGPDRKLQEYVY